MAKIEEIKGKLKGGEFTDKVAIRKQPKSNGRSFDAYAVYCMNEQDGEKIISMIKDCGIEPWELLPQFNGKYEFYVYIIANFNE